MLKLIKQIKAAASGDLSMDWLKPFMTKRTAKQGEILFRKGDQADRMFFVVSGRLHLHQLDIDVPVGTMVGELGMLAPERQRTQTLECIEPGSVLEISYDRIEKLYFQNPAFGFYFLKLSSGRLFENMGRLEHALADRDGEIARLRAAVT